MPLLPCADVECCCGGTGLGCFVPARRTYHDSLAELYGELTFEEALWVCTVPPMLSTLIFCLPVVRCPLALGHLGTCSFFSVGGACASARPFRGNLVSAARSVAVLNNAKHCVIKIVNCGVSTLCFCGR